MSVLDRVNRSRRQTVAGTTTGQAADSSTQTIPSSTLAVSEPPVIHRLRTVFEALQRFIQENDADGMGRLAGLMTPFMDELADELSEKDTRGMQVYMAQIGEVIAWVGHGDNERLSPALREFAEMIQPTRRPAQPKSEEVANAH